MTYEIEAIGPIRHGMPRRGRTRSRSGLAGIVRRWRNARAERLALRRLDEILHAYPDYLLKDIGYIPYGRLRHFDRQIIRL